MLTLAAAHERAKMLSAVCRLWPTCGTLMVWFETPAEDSQRKLHWLIPQISVVSQLSSPLLAYHAPFWGECVRGIDLRQAEIWIIIYNHTVAIHHTIFWHIGENRRFPQQQLTSVLGLVLYWEAPRLNYQPGPWPFRPHLCLSVGYW